MNKAPGAIFTTRHFLRNLQMGKLESYIRLNLKGLSGTQIQAYWVDSQVRKAAKFCEYSTKCLSYFLRSVKTFFVQEKQRMGSKFQTIFFSSAKVLEYGF